jgi:hypothetical protein
MAVDEALLDRCQQTRSVPETHEMMLRRRVRHW